MPSSQGSSLIQREDLSLCPPDLEGWFHVERAPNLVKMPQTLELEQ